MALRSFTHVVELLFLANCWDLERKFFIQSESYINSPVPSLSKVISQAFSKQNVLYIWIVLKLTANIAICL